MNFKNQTFYKLVSEYNEITIGYCYKNPDMNNELGIGFNIADDGGWMPISDITKETNITEVEFIEVKE